MFFNLEILRDQIQTKVNQSLKSISSCWRQAVSSVQNVSQETDMNQAEESKAVQDFLMAGVSEMTKSTQQVYALSVCLSKRDPQCKSVFQTVQEIDKEQQTQASSMANIFNLYVDKVVSIVTQTLQKMSANP